VARPEAQRPKILWGITSEARLHTQLQLDGIVPLEDVLSPVNLEYGVYRWLEIDSRLVWL
jgi:hypothetical protein